MELEKYVLSSTLLGHSMDVRGVATGVTEEGKQIIVSASRDKKSKIWLPSADGSFQMYQSCEGHTNFVVAACVVPPFEGHPYGLVLTGGNDHTVLAFEIGKPNPLYRLASHKGTVCSICATVDFTGLTVVTGSWDMTAKIWQGQINTSTLAGHSQAVWAVAIVPGGAELQILTGSADHEIRLWERGKTRRTFRGHTDCVRDLAVVDGNRFLSCSNDATIIMWNLTSGAPIHTFYGHTNFIYSIAVLPDGFASVGEDRSLRIWKNDDNPQVIVLPAMSIWSVAALSSGDIVTGSSDGLVRIFTRAEERMASPEALKEFEDSVTHSTVSAQQELGGMKISDIPGPEALLQNGKKDGDTKMIREGVKVVCYSWSESDKKWTKVGDVVGGSGATQNTSGRVLFEGKEYDYVFTVSLDDAGRTLKLPYNITEDPWFAAQKFLENNNLDQSFLDQVANFIVKNVKGVELAAVPSEYMDPFTGGSRYVPGTSSTPFSQPAPIPAAQTQLKKPEPKKPTFDAQKILTDRQLKFIRDEASKELPLKILNTKENEGECYTMRSSAKSEGGPVDSECFAVPSVFYACPVIGPGVGTYAEMVEAIHNFIVTQMSEDAGLASCLLIHSCNYDPDRVESCVDTLCKYLDNLINYPTDTRYRRIRINNRIFQERIAPVRGTIEFLQAAGFRKGMDKLNPDSSEEEFWTYASKDGSNVDVRALAQLKDSLTSTVGFKPELDRNVQVLTSAEVMNRKELPTDFCELQYCLIRIKFPEGLTLQGTFRSTELVGDIYAFVKKSLAMEDAPFCLKNNRGQALSEFTASLSDINLPPAAILNFKPENGAESSFLKAEILSRVQKT